MSGSDFTDIVISTADSRLWSGNIKTGEEISFLFYPTQDSAFHVEGRWQERSLSSSLGYTTGYDTMVHEITLTPSSEFTYDVKR